MSPRTPSSTSRVARGLALVALVLLMGSLSWARTLAVYTVAWLDGSHDPRVGLGPDGFRVVLEHEHVGSLAAEAAGSTRDHVHRLGARLLILLSREAGPHADHVVMLGSDSGPFETGRETRMASTPLKPGCPPAAVPGAVRPDHAHPAPRCRMALGAPPSLTALNVQLRCTRLLI